jgi:hypothetical protein
LFTQLAVSATVSETQEVVLEHDKLAKVFEDTNVDGSAGCVEAGAQVLPPSVEYEAKVMLVCEDGLPTARHVSVPDAHETCSA